MADAGLNNAPSAGGASSGGQVDVKKRHPKTSYGSDYYYNDKRVWEAGHELEFDSTKDAPRIRMAHCDGSYFEYSKGGRKVESVKSHEHKYNQGGLTHTIDNNADLKFNGNVRTSIGKGLHLEINGKTSVAISKELAVSFGKSASIVAVDDLFIVAKNTTFHTGENFNLDIGGDMGIKTKGKLNIRSKDGFYLRSDSKIVAESKSDTKFTSVQGDITTKTEKGKIINDAKNNFSVQTQADFEAKAKNSTTVKSSTITLRGQTNFAKD